MIPLAIVAAVIVAEVILALRWNRFYFTVGLPLFVKRAERLASLEDVSLEELQKRTATAGGAPLVFRRLAPNRIAFRESALGGVIHFTPLMHGLIRRNEGESTVAVVGFANWFIVVGTVALVATLGRRVTIIAPMFLIAFTVIYFIQAVRFWRLAKALGEPAMPPAAQ